MRKTSSKSPATVVADACSTQNSSRSSRSARLPSLEEMRRARERETNDVHRDIISGKFAQAAECFLAAHGYALMSDAANDAVEHLVKRLTNYYRHSTAENRVEAAELNGCDERDTAFWLGIAVGRRLR